MMFQTKPAFPLFMPPSLVIDSWHSSQPGSSALQASSTLATGFDFLVGLDLLEAFDLLDVLHHMRDITRAFVSFQQGNVDAPPIKTIIFARNLNQHGLLTLPDLSTESEIEDSETVKNRALYELCRLSAFVFQMTVLLPNLHRNTNVTIPYARRIQGCLERLTAEFRWHECSGNRDFILWATLMTAWLIQETDLYAWFIEYLVEHFTVWSFDMQSTAKDLPWSRVREIMATFLWLESECERPCAAIWNEAEALRVPNEACVIS
jgi:hypothetical protein